MTVQDLGSIGEFVAAIATVITLAYLAVQIKHNTQQARLTAIREVVSALQAGYAPLHSGDNVRLWRLGQQSPEQLTEEEFFAFTMLLERQFYNFQNIVYQYDGGILDQELFDSVRTSFRDLIHTSGGEKWWQERATAFTRATRQHLKGIAK